MQYLRAYRWGVILRPIEKIDQLSLFSVTCVGILAIVAIPARLGEFARPYLITRKSFVSMTSALGSVFLERVFDVIIILPMFFIVAFLTPLPSWMMKSGIIFLVLLLAAISFIALLFINKGAFLKIANPFIRRLPGKYYSKIEELVDQFIIGFRMIRDVRLILYVAFLSIVIWLIESLAIYALFAAFDFHLSLRAAFTVMVILIIGITIPAAPGFVGNWHFFCILGLTLLGVPKADAVTYAILYHFLAIGMAVVLGLVFLPFNTFFLSDLRKVRQ